MGDPQPLPQTNSHPQNQVCSQDPHGPRRSPWWTPQAASLKTPQRKDSPSPPLTLLTLLVPAHQMILR